MLTWLSQAVRGKLLHAAEGGAEPAALLLVAKGVDHPDTHAGVGEEEQHSGLNTDSRTSLLNRGELHRAEPQALRPENVLSHLPFTTASLPYGTAGSCSGASVWPWGMFLWERASPPK